MRFCRFLLLLSTVFVLRSEAQNLKPAPLDFINTSGIWITGKAYSVQFSREGGTGCQALVPDLSQMPAGFTWTAGGVDNGTLAGTFGATGKYKFSLSVQCAGGVNAALTYTITVNLPLSMPAGPYLAGAHVGAAYATLLRRNGVKPYNLTLVSGTLPPGFQWDADSGVLVGAPTTAGTYNFRVKITDRMTMSGEASYTMVAGPPGGFYTSTDRLEFRAMVGGAADSMPLGVATSDLTVVNYAVSSDAAWLTATPVTGKTPGDLTVRMNPTGLAKGTHQAQLKLTPDGGKSPVTVTVTAQIKDPAPLIGAAPDRLQVDVLPDMGAPRQFQFDFQAWNEGTGTLTASAAVWSGSAAGRTWLSVQPAQFAATPGQMRTLTVSVNAAGLSPGSYRGSIVVSSATDARTIPVLLVVPVTQHVPILKLRNSSWRMAADWVNLEDRFNYDNSYIMVSNGDSATSFDFTTKLDGFAADAVVEPTQGRIGPWPGQMELNFRFNNYRLGVGRREGLLTVTAPGAKGSPAYAKMQLDILSTGQISGSAKVVDVETDTPILVGLSGSTTPLQARIVITNSSNVPVAYRVVSDQPSAVTFDVPAGTVSKDDPVTVTATVDLAKLSERMSKILLAANPSVAAATFRTTPLTVVTPAVGPKTSEWSPALQAAICAPSQLVLGAAAPPGGFRQPADEPLKVRAFVYNDCGVPVADAMVTASFSNGDATLMLPVADAAKGIYEAVWIPGAVAPSAGVTLRATRTGLSAATQKIFGSVIEDSGGPVIFNGGIVNAAKSVAGDPVSPGGVVSIYGRNLASVVEQAAAVPLPRTLAGTKVLIGGIEAPLFYASPGQINAQVPFELSSDASCNVVVLSGNRVSTPKVLQLVKLDPGVVAYADGRVIAQHADYSLITASSPARPNEAIILYLVGMGPTSVSVSTGAATPYPPLIDVNVQPEITIGGIKAKANWAGLVPGGVGLYQVVCTVPDSAPAGDLALVLSQDNVAANQTKLPVAR